MIRRRMPKNATRRTQSVRRAKPAIERFTAKYRIEGDCWLWLGAKNSKGYGLFLVSSGKGMAAHKFAYEHFVCDVPNGLELDHLCRKRDCVNPAHLEPVTHKENLRRSPFFGEKAQACRKGHPYDESNTRRNRRGYRYCAICFKEGNLAARKRYLAKRAEQYACT